MAENKGINGHSNKKFVTVEDNLNKKLDGLKNDFEHKWDNLQDSIEDLIDQQQCPPEEECQSDTMAEEQCQQQPHQGLIEDFIELSEGLSESSYMCDVVFPRENQEEILPFITKEGSEKEIVEEPQELVLKPFSTKLNPTATAQATKRPLPVAPSTDQIYILHSPASQSQPKTPEAPSTKATPLLLVLQNIRKLVATVRAFATTSKTQAAAHIACHYIKDTSTRTSTLLSSPPPPPPPPPLFVLIFPVLFYFFVFYLDFYNFSFYIWTQF